MKTKLIYIVAPFAIIVAIVAFNTRMHLSEPISDHTFVIAQESNDTDAFETRKLDALKSKVELDRNTSTLKETSDVAFSHPLFSKFQKIDKKILPTDKDLEDTREILRSKELVELAKNHLLHSSEDNRLNDDKEVKRMMRITFLARALRWKDNPIRDDVVRAISEIILSEDAIRKGMDLDLKKSIAGDKIELFWILEKYAPAEAESLLIESEGHRFRKLLTYAKENFEKNKARL